jgi:hypothetical protein
VDVAAQKQPTVLVMHAELGVAVAVARFEDPRWRRTGEYARLSLRIDEVFAELPLPTTNPIDREEVSSGCSEVRCLLYDSLDGESSPLVGIASCKSSHRTERMLSWVLGG